MKQIKADKFVTIAIPTLWVMTIGIAFADLDTHSLGKQLSWALVNLSVLTSIIGNQFI